MLSNLHGKAPLTLLLIISKISTYGVKLRVRSFVTAAEHCVMNINKRNAIVVLYNTWFVFKAEPGAWARRVEHQ